jgi:outer membrane protein insertion porin family
MLKIKAEVLFAVLITFLLAACSNSRHLPVGDSLFRGSKVHILDNEVEKKKGRKSLENDLAAGVRPKTNSKTLGIRLKLTLYNFAGDTKKKKGLRRWLRNKVGEPPVLTSSVNLNYNKGLMVNYLQNRGYFGAIVSAKTDTTKKKKATAVFEVATGPQYKINKVYFDRDSSEISKKIDSEFSKTLLTPGAPYNLELIKGERSRIDAELKESGYFYFKPDYILDIVDSSIGDNKVNMYLKLKKREIPGEAYRAYFTNNIYIYTDYKLQGESEDTAKANAVKADNYNIIDNGKDYKTELLTKAIIIH